MTQAPTNAFRPGYVYNPADAPPTTFYSPTAEANQRALEEARRKAQAPDFLDAVVVTLKFAALYVPVNLVLSLLPAGPDLSQEAALVAHDALPADPTGVKVDPPKK